MKSIDMRYEFPTEMRKLNSRVMNMSESDRRKFELDRYTILKDSTEGNKQQDGSVIFYVINSSWIHNWRSFIKESYSMPTEIDNFQLKTYIQEHRQKNPNNTGFDNEIPLKLSEDFEIFS